MTKNFLATLEILHSIAMLQEKDMAPATLLENALEILTRAPEIIRAAITVVNPKSGKLRIEAACGLQPAQKKLGIYMRGEGITGQVVENGQPALLVDSAHTPGFLNRTKCGDRDNGQISFLCIPLQTAGQTIGALSIDRVAAPESVLNEELKFLRVIAAMLAPTVARSRENAAAKREVALAPGFVGTSPPMLHVYDQISIVAPSHASVLLLGESGVGKELAARAIHNASPRAEKPFVALNCAALPETLIESELFGHERGAFTGASHTRRGRFEQANGGTLFLDEIGELSALVQAKLLRVLQEGSFERLGGIETIRPDARVIAASNRNLAEMVENGAFRRDLFYRLNVFPIHLPPLRERKEDILPLAAHFLERFAKSDKGKKTGFSLAAMTMLEKYDWPGNIRELQNAMERAALLIGRDNLVLPGHLPAALQMRSQHGQLSETGATPHANLSETLADIERASIADALAATGGHMGNAAAMLGLTQRVLGLRMNRYGLDYKNYRNKPAQ